MSTTHRTYTAQRTEISNGKAGLTLTLNGETVQTVNPGKRPAAAGAVIVVHWADEAHGIHSYRADLAAARKVAQGLRERCAADYLLHVEAIEITAA